MKLCSQTPSSVWWTCTRSPCRMSPGICSRRPGNLRRCTWRQASTLTRRPSLCSPMSAPMQSWLGCCSATRLSGESCAFASDQHRTMIDTWEYTYEARRAVATLSACACRWHAIHARWQLYGHCCRMCRVYSMVKGR